jgi:GT2 family glycosyltransferase
MILGTDDVTVAVVVKDRRALMARCLESLFSQEGVRPRIVVVDNCSTDGTYDDLLRHADAGRIQLLRDAGGLGRIRNVALAAASTTVVAFTDSDCECHASWLRELIAPFEDATVDVVQGRTVPAGPDTDPFPHTQRIEKFSGRFEACNIAYRRASLADADGFDESVGQFGEDTAAGWRVCDRGGRAVFVDAAVVEHAVTYPGRRALLRRARGYAAWPALVGHHPAIRRDLLWHRLFLRPTSAAFDAASLGVLVALSTRRLRPLALALPYAVIRRPHDAGREAITDTLTAALFDAVVCTALVCGSIRARTLVL